MGVGYHLWLSTHVGVWCLRILLLSCCGYKVQMCVQLSDKVHPDLGMIQSGRWIKYDKTCLRWVGLPYLHTINQRKHSAWNTPPFCTQCGQGGSQIESTSHLLVPVLNFTRTLAHNQACKILEALLHQHFAAHWSIYSETLLSQTGLVLELVPTVIVLQSRRQVSDLDTAALQMSLGRWQPHFVAIP